MAELIEIPARIKALKRFIRDLLQYDESLVGDARTNQVQDNTDSGWIIVDELNSRDVGRTQLYDRDNESMAYTKVKQARIAISFYGDGAANRADEFELLLLTEAAQYYQGLHGIAVFNPSASVNVKHLTGAQQSELYQLEVDMRYNIESTSTIMRIDTPVITTITD